MSFIGRLCSGFGLFSAIRPRRKTPQGTTAHSGASATTGICSICNSSSDNICNCFHTRGTMVPTSSSSSSSSPSPSTASDDATPPPRCLLLGLAGSGKTTFLNRIKTGEYVDVEPTSDFLVEEIPADKKGETITFIEVGGTNRRGIRLQFLQAIPGLGISILFFIDVTSSPEALRKAFEELLYVISYTQERACSIHYLGVVLNKQDLLNSSPASLTGRTRKKSLSWGSKKSSSQQKQPRIDLDLEKYVAVVVSEVEENERGDSQSEIVKWIKKEVGDAIEKHKLAQPEELDFRSELIYTGPDRKGVSTKTGDGVQEVYHRLVQGMKAGRERSSLSVLERIAEENQE